MGMSTFPNRQAIDAADSLTFEPKPVKLTIHAEQGGWPIDVEVTIGLEKLPAALAKLTAAGLTPRQHTPGAAPAAAQKPRQPRLQPDYNTNGDPCCPVHKKPLREGQYGLHCTAKEDGPDSKNGYCNLKFVD